MAEATTEAIGATAVKDSLFQVVNRSESLGERGAIFVDLNLRETNPPEGRSPLTFVLSGLDFSEAVSYPTGEIVKLEITRPT